MKNRPLSVEKLEEKRLLASINAPDLMSEQTYIEGFASGPSNPVNQAPVLVNPIAISGGDTVTSAVVVATVLGADDQPETGLRYNWSVIQSPEGATVNFPYNGRNSAKSMRIGFNKPGDYEVMVTIVDAGGLSVSDTHRFTVARNLSSITVTSNETGPVNVYGQRQYTAKAFDQFKVEMVGHNLTWALTKTAGTITTGGLFTASANVGSYILYAKGIRYNGAGLSGRTTIDVVNVPIKPILTDVIVSPDNAIVESGKQQQYIVISKDQFGNNITSQVTWQSTGGTIDANGLFTAGSTIGAFSVKAIVQFDGVTIEKSVVTNVTWPAGKPQLNDADLNQLVDFYFSDLFLDRSEVMSVLRYVVEDGQVDSIELGDLRVIITTTYYGMPDHIRALAYDVLHTNPANLKFKGQVAGNLQAGSSSTLLNNLVDKWFLGADVPVAGSNMTYVASNGSVFNGPLVANQTQQGYVGDCYFIASIISIAGRNPEKITGMFIDNGDSTYTIRWHKAGVPTYVTVNKQLPTVGGRLQYAGLGQDALSSVSVLWGALLEKAYAQWNETGESGRNGTNTYSGIESGWMHNVNAQILGYSSANYSFSSSPESVIRDAVLNGLAVTVGTRSTVQSGWVGGHAYYISGYNATTGKYTLINPWGYNHLTVSWTEMQTNCTIFTTTFVT